MATERAAEPGYDRPPGRASGRLGWVFLPLAAFVGLAVLFAFSLRSGDPSKLPSALLGKPVPAFDLPPLEGLMDGGRPVPGFSNATLGKGAPTVVNFWASWCVPCVQEHPLLLELARRTGVPVYGINYKDQTESARRFLGRYGNPYEAVGVDSSGRVAIEWGVYGMPETFVVDGEGRIVFKQVGPITPEALATKLIPAITAARSGSAGKS
jgi:cytochrome c biogenesis protein CcmG/thiol:disulfide interchange protein DsbE